MSISRQTKCTACSQTVEYLAQQDVEVEELEQRMSKFLKGSPLRITLQRHSVQEIFYMNYRISEAERALGESVFVHNSTEHLFQCLPGAGY